VPLKPTSFAQSDVQRIYVANPIVGFLSTKHFFIRFPRNESFALAYSAHFLLATRPHPAHSLSTYLANPLALSHPRLCRRGHIEFY
jgi:hypothetical protein